ncbi:MAG: disulfide bond formation protein B [Gammaproteobacteria bacterium]|nr:disulfide bond formation protein B [Gammaproteobacteria bacterium]MDH3767819.1 disulfide bond formation protein B [Gammaproteobacteria bacterium]
MSFPLSVRQINFAGAASCAGMMGFALYSQYVAELNPCPLCVFQRIAVIALGVIFLVAFIHNSQTWGRYVYALLFIVAAGVGIGVAGRHAWLQSLPPDQVPACGPDLAYLLDSFPLGEALKKVFTGSGECAEIVWQFMGLSMPMWVLICCVILGVTGVVNSMRRQPDRL